MVRQLSIVSAAIATVAAVDAAIAAADAIAVVIVMITSHSSCEPRQLIYDSRFKHLALILFKLPSRSKCNANKLKQKQQQFNLAY